MSNKISMSNSCKFSFINFKQFVLKERCFLYANNDNHTTISKNKPILMFEKNTEILLT